MYKKGGNLILSAGDLVGHLNCRYLTSLDVKLANGELSKPKIWDPVLERWRSAVPCTSAITSII